MKNLVWFAKKRDGEVIPLSEKEALTHFRSNNIKNRMGLEFIGTSDGAKYRKELAEVEKMIIKAGSLPEDEANVLIKDAEKRKRAAFDAEVEIAMANGVRTPDHALDYIVVEGPGNVVNESRKKEIMRRM